MPLKIIHADITKLDCDAIVNAANPSLLGGGVDGAIHKAAGERLLKKCKTLGGCATGEAKLTKGYDLPCKYVIHTVGPVWRGGNDGEEALLRSCYRSSLALAKSKRCKTVAFPLISSGAYGYPKDQALSVAVDEITAFLADNDISVFIVIFDKDSYKISEKLFDDISSFIDGKYTDESLYFPKNSFLIDFKAMPQAPREPGVFDDLSATCSIPPLSGSCDQSRDVSAKDESDGKPQILKDWSADGFDEYTVTEYAPDDFSSEHSRPLFTASAPSKPEPDFAPKAAMSSLNDELKKLDESFSEALLRKIDEKGWTDAECYKKANIDRKLFSKIRSNRLYKPSKTTAIAFCIALELPLDETKDMLMKAGFALSHSNKFDIIIEYFITNENYNVFEINEALFAFDQNLLGA